MAQILLLEDDREVREELMDYLCAHGHKVRDVSSLRAFHEQSSQPGNLDIAIVDISLPDGSGYEAVSSLRAISHRMGIIILTARSAMEDRLHGLADGADHFLVKPFSLIELGGIVDALLRRVGLSWCFDATQKALSAPSGRAMNLNVFECELFALLSSTGGATVSRESLVHAMGHDWANFDLRRLDTAISRLRARWKLACGEPLPLRTRHGVGYSFDYPVRKI